ncbi:hypothetical protein, partial [Streptococcus equi]|uniref:hypothetical protein n=2 Tax=Streptococcus equi TaxID=1336 RepID=UPI001969A6AD
HLYLTIKRYKYLKTTINKSDHLLFNLYCHYTPLILICKDYAQNKSFFVIFLKIKKYQALSGIKAIKSLVCG